MKIDYIDATLENKCLFTMIQPNESQSPAPLKSY